MKIKNITIFVFIISCQLAISKDYPLLSKLDLDRFTESFMLKNLSGEIPSKEKFAKLAKDNKNISTLYSNILNLKLGTIASSTNKLKELTLTIFQARNELRKDPIRFKDAILLYEVLAEETAYAYSHMNPSDKSHWSFVFSEIADSDCENSLGVRTGNLGPIKICQGDILLSKGTQASSSFIARITDYPGSFSHSTIFYVSPQNRELSLLEAHIEDGNKIRSAREYEAPKGKVFIFRANKKFFPELDKIINAVDDLRDMFYAKVSDPLAETAFPYDPYMDATDSNKLFCSEVGYLAYKMSGSKLNPYPEARWSTISGLRGDFYKKFLKITNLRYPSPSDLELNLNFDVVAALINPNGMNLTRINDALIDELISFLELNPDKTKTLLNKIDSLDTYEIDKDKITEFPIKNGIAKKIDVEKYLKDLPENANINQVVFFGLVNMFIMPKTIEAIKKMQSHENKIIGPNKLRDNVSNILIGIMKELEAKLETK